MLDFVWAALAAAFVFYLLVPVAGAFVVRGRWRSFRRRVAALSRSPRLRYRDIAAAMDGFAAPGSFRLYGRLEAMEGTGRIWLRGEGLSAVLDLSRAPLYVLEREEGAEPRLEKTWWSSIPSLAEGTAFLVAGALAIEGSVPVFTGPPDEPPLAICYDGPEDGLVSALVAAGRRQNEYWHPLTVFSLALGVAVSSGILVLMAGRPVLTSLRALAFLAAIAPVLPFAPPGLGLYLLYRRLWRRALELRTLRDLLLLPLRYFPDRGGAAPDPESPGGRGEARAPLPEGGAYLRTAVDARADGLPLWPVALGLPGEEGAEECTLFEAEDSSDPAAERVLVAGEPERLAARAALRARLSALGAGAAFALALIINYALAFAAWRSLR